MSADPYTRSGAQAGPRVSRPRRAFASALAAGLALLVALPLGAQPAASQPAAPPQPAPAEAPADALSPAAPDTDTVGNVSARRSWAWVAVGTGVAFATTSAMLALAVESREADIEFLIDFRAPIINTPNRYEGEARGRYEELVDEAETLSKYAWITLGLAGAAALTATALFVLDGGVGPEETDADADAKAGARGVTSRGPAVTPGVVPGGMGVTLDWEF